jgi:hypothetical protein
LNRVGHEKKVMGTLVLATFFFRDFSFNDLLFLSYNKFEDGVEVESPDHNYSVVGYHMLGGAVSRNCTVILIRSKNERLNYRTNAPLLVVDNLGPFNISWVKNDELAISFTSGPIDLQKFGWKNVTVRYIQK